MKGSQHLVPSEPVVNARSAAQHFASRNRNSRSPRTSLAFIFQRGAAAAVLRRVPRYAEAGIADGDSLTSWATTGGPIDPASSAGEAAIRRGAWRTYSTRWGVIRLLADKRQGAGIRMQVHLDLAARDDLCADSKGLTTRWSTSASASARQCRQRAWTKRDR
jgi:hypothetical protein